MAEHDGIDRIDRFETEIARLRLKTSGGMLEQVSGVVGVLMMAAGIGIAIGAALKAGTKQDPRDLQELIILGLAMVTMVVAGAALFLQRALAQFWRYWMLRQTYEHQRHIDLVLEGAKQGVPDRNVVQLVTEQPDEAEQPGRPEPSDPDRQRA